MKDIYSIRLSIVKAIILLFVLPVVGLAQNINEVTIAITEETDSFQFCYGGSSGFITVVISESAIGSFGKSTPGGANSLKITAGNGLLFYMPGPSVTIVGSDMAGSTTNTDVGSETLVTAYGTPKEISFTFETSGTTYRDKVTISNLRVIPDFAYTGVPDSTINIDVDLYGDGNQTNVNLGHYYMNIPNIEFNKSELKDSNYCAQMEEVELNYSIDFDELTCSPSKIEFIRYRDGVGNEVLFSEDIYFSLNS
jgi:hypothetical protein